MVCTDHLSPGFFPLNLTGLVLASPGELCILRTHLYGADQAPLSSAVERREVAGSERWVDVLERMWGLHGNLAVSPEAAYKVCWVLILLSPSKPMQRCFGDHFQLCCISPGAQFI